MGAAAGVEDGAAGLSLDLDDSDLEVSLDSAGFDSEELESLDDSEDESELLEA